MKKITITTKLTLEDFKKVNLYLFYKSMRIKIITGICLFILISSTIIFSLGLIPFDRSSYPQFAVIIAIIVIPYFGVLINSKRTYKSNKVHQESIQYEFENDAILITGESSYISVPIDTLFNIVETRHFFLIFQNPQFANVIPKRDISKEQIESIKRMARN